MYWAIITASTVYVSRKLDWKRSEDPNPDTFVQNASILLLDPVLTRVSFMVVGWKTQSLEILARNLACDEHGCFNLGSSSSSLCGLPWKSSFTWSDESNPRAAEVKNAIPTFYSSDSPYNSAGKKAL